MEKNLNIKIPNEIYLKMQNKFSSEKELTTYFTNLIKEEAEYLADDKYIVDFDEDHE